jgi:hypothetical protein
MDRTNENPFQVVRTGDIFRSRIWLSGLPKLPFSATSDSEVCRQLAQDDPREIEYGIHHIVHMHIAPGLFINLRLELEDLQCMFVVWIEYCSAWINVCQCLGVGLPWMWLRWNLMQQIWHQTSPVIQDSFLCPVWYSLVAIYEWDLRYTQGHSTLNDLRGPASDGINDV